MQYFGPFLHFQNVGFYVLSQNMLGYIPLKFELSDTGLLASVMDIFGLFCTFCSPKWKLKLLPIVVLTSYYDFCHSFHESVCSGLRNSAFL